MISMTTKEGVALRVFSSMYMDWGLEITGPDGEELYYNPSCLCCESYGYQLPEDEDGNIDYDAEESIPWDNATWADCLAGEADELVEALAYKDIEWVGRNGAELNLTLFGWECVA